MENHGTGWIELVCGSMFSGKSEELIRRVRLALYAKRKVIAFKPQIDNRYLENSIVSHNGNTLEAIPVATSKDIVSYIKDDVDVIAIDEIQFFDEGIITLVQDLANRGYRVVVAGLDQDFRGNPFGPMGHLMTIAEYVTKLHAVCNVCGSPASRTQRLVNGEPASYHDPVVLVGAKENYEPRCRHHHIVKDAPHHLK